MKIPIGISLCVVPFLANAQPTAAEIQISTGNCPSSVRLVARNALLSDVLARLAESLGFQLQFEGNPDSVVNVNVAMPAPELVAKLSTMDSVIVAQSPDPRCPRQNRIVKVWVLPKAKDHKLDRAAPTQASETSREQSMRFEEMSRQAKEAYQAYVRIHGRPPPGEEEEVGKPR